MSRSRTTVFPAASNARTATTWGPGPRQQGADVGVDVSSAVSKMPSAAARGRHSRRPSTATSTRAIGPTPSTTSARSRRPLHRERLEDGRRVVDQHGRALEGVVRRRPPAGSRSRRSRRRAARYLPSGSAAVSQSSSGFVRTSSARVASSQRACALAPELRRGSAARRCPGCRPST